MCIHGTGCGCQSSHETHRLKCRVIELEAVLREASEWFGGGEALDMDHPENWHEGDRIRQRMRAVLTKTSDSSSPEQEKP
jgi:hypothetical protein